MSFDYMSIQFSAVQIGLRFKIDTGMEMAHKTAISVAKRNGWTFGTTSRQALRDVNYMAVAMGREPRWSEKFGDESDKPVTIEIAFDTTDA